jgi:DNA-binding NarL/FixJ family response regulator
MRNRITLVGMGERRLRLVVVDDHTLVRDALRLQVEQAADMHIVGEAGDARSAELLIQQVNPDVVVIDISLPGVSGIAVTRELSRHDPHPYILVLSMYETVEFVAQAVAAGADGYALKLSSGSEIIDAIRVVARGKNYLSPKLAHLDFFTRRPGWQKQWEGPLAVLSEREREIFDLVVSGLDSQAIAAQLFISVKTVDTHRTNLMRKLDLHSVAEMVRFAARHSMLRE